MRLGPSEIGGPEGPLLLAGPAAATGASLLLPTKTTASGRKPLFPFKCPTFYSHTRNCRWNSNGESSSSQYFKFRNRRYSDNDAVEEDDTGNGKKRGWWSDKPPEEEPPSILEEFIDSLWILKLSKFYGWTLPPMIISALIATGPKAFLMTLAFPVGQSVISFVFQKLTGRTRSKPRRRARKRKPFVSYPGNVEAREESVKGNEVPRSRVVDDDPSVKNDKQGAYPSFGGWDELDEIGMESMPPCKAEQSGRKAASMRGKLGTRRGESDAPLLLRLLIAVFPFLASWTKML